MTRAQHLKHRREYYAHSLKSLKPTRSGGRHTLVCAYPPCGKEFKDDSKFVRYCSGRCKWQHVKRYTTAELPEVRL